MTKITLIEAGMKVRINNEEKLIVSHVGLMSLLDLASFEQDGFYSRANMLDYLIANNAELIEENEKVVVSAEVAETLIKIEGIRNNNFYSFVRWIHDLWESVSFDADGTVQEWLDENNISNQDLLNIYENGWESERLEIKKGQKYYFVNQYGRVECRGHHDAPIDKWLQESRNQFVTCEEAEVKAKQIREILAKEMKNPEEICPNCSCETFNVTVSSLTEVIEYECTCCGYEWSR